jgi:low affinity Fe/Cu permease
MIGKANSIENSNYYDITKINQKLEEKLENMSEKPKNEKIQIVT